MGRGKTVVTRTETSADEEEVERVAEREKDLDVALFDDLGSTDDTRISRIEVAREDPDEGYLGTVEPSATNLEIYNRWGGSKYSFTAKNARGRIVTKRTMKIGGEPMFLSEVAEMRWRRANGLGPKKKDGSARDEGEFSAKELMALMETKLAAERADAETREERRRREDLEREEKARRDEREWRAQQEKDRTEREERIRREDREHAARMEAQRREDDKRREDRIREDEQRREKDHERQLAAATQAAKEAQEKNQQFFTNMLAMTKANEKVANADPMAQVTQILTLVEALKGAAGGGEQDAVTTLLSRLPETLQAAGGMVASAVREAKGLPPAGQQQAGDEDDEPAEPGEIKLTGAAAQKVRELITHLMSKGHDPEKVLVKVADHLMGKGGGGPAVVAAREIEGKRQAAKKARRRPKRAPAPAATKEAAPAPAPARPAPLVKPAPSPAPTPAA